MSDKLSTLLDDAIAAAGRAAAKFPQPTSIPPITKVAEEAGEVVKAAVHCAEGRDTPAHVREEIVDAMAMLIRLFLEGDETHGLPSIAANT